MSIETVANGVADCCRRGQFFEAINTYYGDDVVSVEPVGNEQMPAEMSGIAAIRAKNEFFAKNFDVHSISVEGPFVSGDGFALKFDMDATQKESGQRTRMVEMAKYSVSDGKVVREEFFYNVPGA